MLRSHDPAVALSCRTSSAVPGCCISGGCCCCLPSCLLRLHLLAAAESTSQDWEAWEGINVADLDDVTEVCFQSLLLPAAGGGLGGGFAQLSRWHGLHAVAGWLLLSRQLLPTCAAAAACSGLTKPCAFGPRLVC